MKSKREVVFAFIDSQNLNLGTSLDIYRNRKKIYSGWKLDYKKFHKYLLDKFRVQKAILFIGYIQEYEPLYKNMRKYGYELVFKPTVKDKLGKPKGNVDAELVLHAAAIEFKNYDSAVIVSGDGDFRCLHEYLKDKGKLKRIIVPNAKSVSTLLSEFHEYQTFIEFERLKLELEANKNGRRRK